MAIPILYIRVALLQPQYLQTLPEFLEVPHQQIPPFFALEVFHPRNRIEFFLDHLKFAVRFFLTAKFSKGL